MKTEDLKQTSTENDHDTLHMETLDARCYAIRGIANLYYYTDFAVFVIRVLVCISAGTKMGNCKLENWRKILQAA